LGVNFADVTTDARLAVDVVFVVVIDAPPIAARALKLIVDIVIIVVE